MRQHLLQRANIIRRDPMEKEILAEEMESVSEIDHDLMDKWLTFWLDGQLYAFPVTHVEGIISILPITTVPEYPAYAKGIIDLRGVIVPVLDLRLRFGKREAAYTDKTCIINCRVGERNIGFIVDEVEAVLSISGEMISNPPRMASDPDKRYLTGIARVPTDEKEKIILCLDATKVLCRDEIEQLITE